VSNTYQPKSESVRDVRMSAFQPNRFAAAFENGIVQVPWVVYMLRLCIDGSEEKSWETLVDLGYSQEHAAGAQVPGPQRTRAGTRLALGEA
jgi:hypothetical protein